MSYDSSQGTNGQSVSSMKIKTVKRGYSTESDKLLDFLVREAPLSNFEPKFIDLVKEKGIFEAIEKQYLASFIFAVYLVCLT